MDLQLHKAKDKVAISDVIFGRDFNEGLVHQAVVSYLAGARAGTRAQKNRAEVSGGGKKPWAQKGTGRARHGSSRSPIWRGGGITHGPTTERNWDKKINKKMRDKALFIVLSQKLRDGEIMFVDDIAFDEPKTKTAMDAIAKLATMKGNET